MKKYIFIIFGASALLLTVACNSRKSTSDVNTDAVIIMDSVRSDTLHHPSPEEFNDDHMPPPPPPHGKGQRPQKYDNMRGFDPASEDDMEDNGMSRYMENNDEEGWD